MKLFRSAHLPRPEYPTPQFARSEWLNLNGEWEFSEDFGISGIERGLARPGAAGYDKKITVPFCRESVLSGIGNVDFCECVWYRRKLTLPEGWQTAGRRVIFHIGASDYETTVYVNGKAFRTHIGGYVEFSYDITPALVPGENVLVIRALDLLRSKAQPGGKQSQRYDSHGCSYTRTTGIWQTLWLESVPDAYLTGLRIVPDVAGRRAVLTLKAENADGRRFTAEAFYEGKKVGHCEGTVTFRSGSADLPLSELHLWEVGEGRLYDLTVTLGDDTVHSYFGMRSVDCKDGFLYLNGKPVFQRLVLDQGFYPDGIYTAPTAKELENDILRSMAMGFNGARLHQKVFEPLFLYYADKLGYIVWGEHANWGLDISRPESYQGFFPEWVEIVERDINHPAIIGWCPLNETQFNQNDRFLIALADLTRALDPTRLYIDASGWKHVDGLTDMMDCHDYDQNPATFRERYDSIGRGETLLSQKSRNAFDIKPTFVSEYGGIRWSPAGNGWGYGNAPTSGEEFISRFTGLTEALLDNPAVGGLCYTQLTDVEQEQNGLYTYSREAKFDPAIFRAVLSKKAAIEQ